MHPTEQFSANSIAQLQEAEFQGPTKSNAPIVPGISLSWDTEAEGLAVNAQSFPGELLSIEQVVDASPRWLELHIALGHATFVPGDVFGLAIETHGLEEYGFSFFVRTFFEDHFLNTDLLDPLPQVRDVPVRTVMHTISSLDPIVEPERFHTLIMRLPKQTGKMTLSSLRIFVLPATRGLASTPPSLSRALDVQFRA